MGGAVALLAVFGFYIFKFYSYIAQSQLISSKYTNAIYMQGVNSYDFKLQLINVLFNIVLWITLFLYFGLFTRYNRQTTNKLIRGIKLVIKITGVLIISFCVVFVKTLICPIGMIKTIEFPRKISVETTTLVIEDDYTDFSITRITGYSSYNTVYKNTKVSLIYLNKPFFKFNKLYQENGLLTKHLIEIEVPNTDHAYRYDFDAIAYTHKGDTFAIKFDKINSYKKANDRLINICEHLIEEDYFEAFEYSYKYLLKYDPDFITPYIEKYTRQDFSQEFYQINSNINPQYIKEFANNIK